MNQPSKDFTLKDIQKLLISCFVFIFLINITIAQESNISKASLPETVFGEWQGETGNGEYNGISIHPIFIETGYRAFMYQIIYKGDNGVYFFDAKDNQGNTISYQLEVVAKDSIKLKLGDNPFRVFVKHQNPLDGKHITISEVPNELKRSWFTTDGENNLEFSVGNQEITFRNKAYTIEEIVSFTSKEPREYRFVVKNDQEYWMFYFKNWDEHYLQVGFNGKAGDMYKAKKEYPNFRIKNFSEYASSANGKRHLSNKKGASAVPEKVSKWIDDELAKVNSTPLEDFESPEFFKRANAKLIGFLKGYDPSLGFKTGIIYLRNNITREDYPIVLQIHPNGKFEATLPLTTPLYTHFVIENKWIPFYIEPEQTLSVTLDLLDLLAINRISILQNKLKNIEYDGPLAKENEELLGFSFRTRDYEAYKNKIRTVSPKEFKNEQLIVLEENLHQLDKYKNNSIIIENENALDAKVHVNVNSISPKVYTILKNKILLQNAVTMFDFVMDREYEARKDTINTFLQESVPIEFYDFLKTMPLNDKNLLVSTEFGTFINRFEYCDPFMKTSVLMPTSSFEDRWKMKDLVLVNELGLENNLTYEISKIRSVAFEFGRRDKETAKAFWDRLKKDITNPFLQEEGNRILEKVHPTVQQTSYKLPDTKATNVFREIVDPFKGKIVFVDFWATTCAPCVGEIKRMKEIRKQYKGNKDFVFVFITEERSSPINHYTKFVQEQELEHIYRLPLDDYNYLRELFKFNGIPRYVVLNKDGNVLNDDFPMHNFDFELNGILEESK